MRGIVGRPLGSPPDAGDIGCIQHVIFGGEQTMFVYDPQRDGWDLMRSGALSTSCFVSRLGMLEYAAQVAKAQTRGQTLTEVFDTSDGTSFEPDELLGIKVRTSTCLSFAVATREMAKFLAAIQPLVTKDEP